MLHHNQFTRRLAMGVLVGLFAAQAAAQTPSKPPPPPRAPQPARAPAPPPPPPAPPPPPGQPLNIRIDLTLTDSVDGKVIAEEKFNTLLADRQLGRARRRNGPPAGVGGFLPTTQVFEVDVTPEIVSQKSGIPPVPTVKVMMTINYMAPAGPTGGDEKSVVTFVQNVSSFLESGKPTTIMESKADPSSNRRVAVQVTATIMK